MSTSTLERPLQVTLPPMIEQAWSLLDKIDPAVEQTLQALTPPEYVVASKRALALHPREARQAATTFFPNEPEVAANFVKFTEESVADLLDETIVLAGEQNIKRAQQQIGTTTLSKERLRASCQGATTGVIEAYQVPDVENTEVAERNYLARLAISNHDELTYFQEHPTLLSVAEAEIVLAGALTEVKETRARGDRASEIVLTGAIQFILRRTPAIGKILRSIGL